MDAVFGDGDVVALTPPAWRYTLTEVPRGAAGVLRLAREWRSMAEGARGRGEPVMVLPGLFNSDRSNVALRRHLMRMGYRVEGWGLGRNLGQRAIGGNGERLFARIETMAQRHGAPVALVGISLGGLMARIAAQRMPERVSRVVTISSPFRPARRDARLARLSGGVGRADRRPCGPRVDRGSRAPAAGSDDGDLERKGRAGRRPDLPR